MKKKKNKEKKEQSANMSQHLRKLRGLRRRGEVDEFCRTSLTMAGGKGLKKAYLAEVLQLVENPERVAVWSAVARASVILGTRFRALLATLCGRLETDLAGKVEDCGDAAFGPKRASVVLLGEFVKFRAYDGRQYLNLYRKLLDHFIGHNIEVVAALLETCGTFLYRSPEHHLRTRNLLDVMRRLRHNRPIGERYATLVDHAYLAVVRAASTPAVQEGQDGPTAGAASSAALPGSGTGSGAHGGSAAASSTSSSSSSSSLHAPSLRVLYAKALVRQKLASMDDVRVVFEEVLRYSRDEWVTVFLPIFLAVHRVKFGQLPALAALLARMQTVHPEYCFLVEDALLERIVQGAEQSFYQHAQRRVAEVRFLAELMNAGVLAAGPLLLRVTELLLAPSGHAPPEAAAFLGDVHSDAFFPLRLVCSLLTPLRARFGVAPLPPALLAALGVLDAAAALLALPLDVQFLLDDTFDAYARVYKRAALEPSASEEAPVPASSTNDGGQAVATETPAAPPSIATAAAGTSPPSDSESVAPAVGTLDDDLFDREIALLMESGLQNRQINSSLLRPEALPSGRRAAAAVDTGATGSSTSTPASAAVFRVVYRAAAAQGGGGVSGSSRVGAVAVPKDHELYRNWQHQQQARAAEDQSYADITLRAAQKQQEMRRRPRYRYY